MLWISHYQELSKPFTGKNWHIHVLNSQKDYDYVIQELHFLLKK